MAEVRLGLGPSLMEKEKKIYDLTSQNTLLSKKLELTTSCLQDIEDRAKTYAIQIIDLKVLLSDKDHALSSMAVQL